MSCFTDDTITSGFPANERKVIREYIPWTRRVMQGYTIYQEQVDLLAFIHANREKLALKPNDEGTEQQTFIGADMDDAAWDRALKIALRDSYVVQEATPPLKCTSSRAPIWFRRDARDVRRCASAHVFGEGERLFDLGAPWALPVFRL